MTYFYRQLHTVLLLVIVSLSVKAVETPTNKPDEAIAEWLKDQPIGIKDTLSATRYNIADKRYITKGASLMSFAAAQGRVDVMEWLARQGLSPSYKNHDGIAPIHYAAFMNQVEALMWLKKNGADLNAQDKNGGTVALHAAGGGSVDALKWLVSNGADISARDNDGATPLFYAAVGGSIDTLQYLKDSGADLTARNTKGQTAKQFAAQYGRPVHALQWFSISAAKAAGNTPSKAVVEWLYDQPIDIDEELSERLRLTKMWGMETGANLMSLAAAQGRVDAMEWLKKQGLSPIAKDSVGEEPIFHAAYMGWIDALAWLKNNGANINSQNNKGMFPMHAAAMGGNVAALQWLKENGANLNSQDKEGMPAIACATISANVGTMQWFKNNGVDVGEEFQMPEIRVPINLAALAFFAGNVDTLQWLLDNNVPLDADLRSHGSQLAHAMAQAGNLEMLQWLKDDGADLDTRDGENKTAAYFAAESGHINVLQWLKDNGVDLSARDGVWRTAVHAAVQNGNIHVLQWFLDSNVDLKSEYYSSNITESSQQKRFSRVQVSLFNSNSHLNSQISASYTITHKDILIMVLGRGHVAQEYPERLPEYDVKAKEVAAQLITSKGRKDLTYRVKELREEFHIPTFHFEGYNSKVKLFGIELFAMNRILTKTEKEQFFTDSRQKLLTLLCRPLELPDARVIDKNYVDNLLIIFQAEVVNIINSPEMREALDKYRG